MDIIQDIRRRYEVERDTPIQGVLERALEHLADQLYRSDTHFVMEFVQNADDNEYPHNVVPMLRMHLEDFKMIMSCNEVGFTERNVRAICDIGNSTKKNNRGFIGEKGIGFKSVFKVADVVQVTSGSFTFKFDRKGKLGMIAPIWDCSIPVTAGWTTFILDLSPSQNSHETTGISLSKQIGQIKPTLLLFLRTLRSIELDVAVGDTGHQRTIHFKRTDVDPNVVQLTRTENSTVSIDRYFIVKDTVSMADLKEQKRQGVHETEIVLAFPIDEHRSPKVLAQDVHAFLPMRKFGFNFLIQADFLTSSSREDILEDSSWNLRIRDAIVDNFVKAVNIFREQPILRNTWIRFLPRGIVDTFFSVIENSLLARIRRLKVVQDSNGNYQVPDHVLTIPPRFRHRGSPLIPEEHMPLYYLSDVYKESLDGPSLRLLGVRDMSNDDFLAGLATMDSTSLMAPDCDSEWHDTICSHLSNIPKLRKRFDNRILNLRILPLDNGTWARAGDANNYMFDMEISGVPDHVNYRRISSNINPTSQRYSFFCKLGVRQANPVLIAERILSSSGRLSIQSHIDNARFFFVHRNSLPSLPNLSGLRFVDWKGKTGVGSTLYLDLPDDKSRLRSVLRSARFIHPGYMLQFTDRDWLDWLHNKFGINTTPRLINNELSPEFKEMTRRLNLRELLDTLRYFWHRWPVQRSAPWHDQLSRMPVTFDDKSQASINSTFLRRGGLARYHDVGILFLPVDDPESEDWNFLGRLGVAMEANVYFYVKLLTHCQTSAKDDDHLVTNIYKQLDARFNEKPSLIRDAFEDHPLIFAALKGSKKTWIHRSDVYWDGPPSMASKIMLRSSFPNLEELFHENLGIPNAPPSILLDELKCLAAKWHERDIGEDIQRRAIDMLVDLGKQIHLDVVNNADVHLLMRDHAVFPVSSGPSRKRLRKLSDIYIPDRSGRYAKIFRDKVPILEPGVSDHRRSSIDFLLNSPACKSLVRNLETSVEHKTKPRGEQDADYLLTAMYTRSYRFIERQIYHRSTPTHRQIEVLSKLKDIAIYTVDAISTTVRLDGITLDSTESVDVTESESNITVLASKEALSSSARNAVHMDICARLNDLLETDYRKLFQIVMTEPDILEEIFRREGINEVDLETSDDDDSWLRTTTRTTLPSSGGLRSSLAIPKSSHNRRRDSHGTNSRGVKIRDSFAMEDMQTEIGRIVDGLPDFTECSIRICSSGNSTVKSTESFFDSVSSPNLPKQATKKQHNATDETFITHASSERLRTTTDMIVSERSAIVQPSSCRDVIGIVGEYYVYKLLSEIIGPTFGPRNWTSHLREHVPGFEPFVDSSLADFAYEDKQGILTEILYKEDCKTREAWVGRWPKYHIEVKCTSSSAREPFYMSSNQFDIALNTTRGAKDGDVPKDVYVLVRVWNARQLSPNSHAFFVDPLRHIRDGGLRVVSEKIELMMGS